MTERLASTENLVWCDVRDPNETIRAKAGIPTGLIHGTPMYADGYATSWITPALEMNGQIGPSPMPVVILEVPDYRRPDAVALLFDTISARAIATELIRLANEAEATMEKHVKQAIKDLKEPEQERARNKRIRDATRCSVETCNRERRYFDESGRGFCKRHAEHFGIRPTGKVT